MLAGSSRQSWKACSHRAPTAPSTVRWSQLTVAVMKLATLKLKPDKCGQFWRPGPLLKKNYPFSESSAISRCCVAPIATMQLWGGFIIAEKCVTPYMPRFETLIVPP